VDNQSKQDGLLVFGALCAKYLSTQLNEHPFICWAFSPQTGWMFVTPITPGDAWG
jgi:hypothetical protein